MKKTIAVFAAALAVGILTGCGSDADKPLKDLDVEKYVTLGEYKGLSVSVEPIAVDDAQVEELMHSVYDGCVTSGVTDRAVENGDTVNIDYEGKKDGVAFEGGTQKGSPLTIGSGKFIEGFEEGLIGVLPGETVDLNLSFPKDYGSADLAGQEVVFTVTVNFILPAKMEDGVVPLIGIKDVNTVEELRQYAYDYLYAQAESGYNLSLQNQVLNAFMQKCTFETVPEKMVERYKETSRKGIEAQAQSYGLDAETFVSYFYQSDLETFVNTYSEEMVKQSIAMQAVANLENLNIGDQELDKMLTEYAQKAGYSTVEEYIGETPREDYREFFLYDRVLQYLVDNAKIENE